jgi:hypothetical protein
MTYIIGDLVTIVTLNQWTYNMPHYKSGIFYTYTSFVLLYS